MLEKLLMIFKLEKKIECVGSVQPVSLTNLVLGGFQIFIFCTRVTLKKEIQLNLLGGVSVNNVAVRTLTTRWDQQVLTM